MITGRGLQPISIEKFGQKRASDDFGYAAERGGTGEA